MKGGLLIRNNSSPLNVDGELAVPLNHGNMRPDLEILLVLQDRDQKIKALQAQQKNLPREKKGLEDRLTLAKGLLEHAKQRLRENEVDRRKLQLEVEGKRANIVRFKNQQQQTRKNEEFQALSNEIKRFEGNIQDLEDRELELMESAEQLQGGALAVEKDFSKAEMTIREQLTKLEAGAVAVQERLGELQNDRSKQAGGLEPDLVELYQRLFIKKGDAAVVPLEHEVCGGCHMKVPVQTVADVRAEQKIAQCPQCGRILYRVI